jgi:hypothetical protein
MPAAPFGGSTSSISVPSFSGSPFSQTSPAAKTKRALLAASYQKLLKFPLAYNLVVTAQDIVIDEVYQTPGGGWMDQGDPQRLNGVCQDQLTEVLGTYSRKPGQPPIGIGAQHF